MIEIEEITLRNFLSVGNVVEKVRLNSHFLTLIVGENRDSDEDNARNGVGKTTMLQALSYALFGEPLADIRADQMINDINLKLMEVSTTFRKDGVTYRIERGRKPNHLRLLVNGDPLKTPVDDALGENKHTQAEIVRLLGMSHTLFTHIVAMNTATIPFLRLRPAPQRELAEELFGFTTVSERDDALSKQISATKLAIRDQESAIKATGEANQRIEGAIARARQTVDGWKRDHAATVQRLDGMLDELRQIDFPTELAAFDRLDEWLTAEQALRADLTLIRKEGEPLGRERTRLRAELTRLRAGSGASNAAAVLRLQAEAARYRRQAAERDDREVDAIHAATKRKQSEIGRYRQAAETIKASIAVRLGQIDDPSEHACALCGQSIDGTDHLATIQARLANEISNLHIQLAEQELIADNLDKEVLEAATLIKAAERATQVNRTELERRATDIENEIVQLGEEEAERVRALEQRLAEVSDEEAEITSRLKVQEAAETELSAELDALGRKPAINYPSREAVWRLSTTKETTERDLASKLAETNPHEEGLASLLSTVHEIDYGPLNDFQRLLKHQDFLHKVLSGKDSFVRKRIVDRNLAFLNERLEDYRRTMGLPHEVRFMPDLTAEITINGRDKSFEQLSTGERQRVVLATAWAFRDMWESLNSSINLMAVDELIDTGMDDAGAEAALSILTQIGRGRGKNVFLISHKEMLRARVDQIMIACKEDSFTTFQTES